MNYERFTILPAESNTKVIVEERHLGELFERNFDTVTVCGMEIHPSSDTIILEPTASSYEVRILDRRDERVLHIEKEDPTPAIPFEQV